MPFFKSLPDNAGPGSVFSAYPEIYRPWAEMGQAIMNGPSPLTPGEREMIAAYVAGLARCRYAYVAHSRVAHEWGIEEGLIDKLLGDLAAAPVAERFKPLLAYVKTLTLAPGEIRQQDADAVFAAGWDEKGLHDAIAVAARMNFMVRLVQGHGFVPMDAARAGESAKKRVKVGYVDLYPAFAGKTPDTGGKA
jgi:uncharacterized peroxidase-related enzyme